MYLHARYFNAHRAISTKWQDFNASSALKSINIVFVPTIYLYLPYVFFILGGALLVLSLLVLVLLAGSTLPGREVGVLGDAVGDGSMGLAGGETSVDNLPCLALLTASIPLCHNIWLYIDNWLPKHFEHLEHLCFFPP